MHKQYHLRSFTRNTQYCLPHRPHKSQTAPQSPSATIARQTSWLKWLCVSRQRSGRSTVSFSSGAGIEACALVIACLMRGSVSVAWPGGRRRNWEGEEGVSERERRRAIERRQRAQEQCFRTRLRRQYCSPPAASLFAFISRVLHCSVCALAG